MNEPEITPELIIEHGLTEEEYTSIWEFLTTRRGGVSLTGWIASD